MCYISTEFYDNWRSGNHEISTAPEGTIVTFPETLLPCERGDYSWPAEKLCLYARVMMSNLVALRVSKKRTQLNWPLSEGLD